MRWEPWKVLGRGETYPDSGIDRLLWPQWEEQTVWGKDVGWETRVETPALVQAGDVTRVRNGWILSRF